MQNGTPGLQTSTGANDVLPWGQDDCVQWHTPMAYSANRPAAWSFGTVNQATCEVYDTKFWTAASNGSGTNAHAFRLNGDTGEIEIDLPLPDFHHDSFGPYGGAVDPDENFWMVSHGTNSDLIRVDKEGQTYTVWAVQPDMFSYGFTIDEYGRPWIGGAGGSNMTLVFDPETEQFTTLPKAGLGMGQATNGLMWQAMFSSQNGVRAWDIDTLEIVTEIDIPVSSSRGVSVDIDGYVWFIEVGSRAFRINPDDETYEVYNGLNGAYTYSDMTGNALSIVAGGIAG
jgi:streptogramin lyase